MYRLSDDIARRRMLYLPPIVTVASVMVIDIPPQWRGAGLLLDRYYAIVLENDKEIEEVRHFLTVPRAGPITPDIFDHQASHLRTDQVVVTRYDPPAAGWPWLSICRWPTSTAASRADMARGCYTMELFKDADTLEGHQSALVASLACQREIKVRMIAGDRLAGAGTC